MHRLTSALLLGGAVLLTSYINAPAAPTPKPSRVSAAEMDAIETAAPLADDATQETERLRAKLAVVPEKPVAKRDPFAFGTSARPPRRAAAPTITESVGPVVDAPPPIIWPKLVALLTDKGTPATITAVLATGDVVEMLKVGEASGGFQIREITTGSIEIVHIATSVATRLALR